MKETVFVRQCLEYLRLKGIMAFRMNSGAILLGGRGKGRMVQLGPPGTSDIIGVLPGGRFLAIECKVGRNKLSATQDAFLKLVNDAGGFGVVVWSLDDLEEAINGL